MKIILSRKGFDSSAGGGPSPLYEDGTLLSLPIPEPKPDGRSVRFSDIAAGGVGLGAIVEELTSGRVAAHTAAHLDPDVRRDARLRPPGWRPLFGQSGAAQTHLANQGVGPGDLFLYFGWFREAGNVRGTHRFRPGARDRHVLFGWLRVGSAYDVGAGARLPGWAEEHPHAFGAHGPPNVIYAARETLDLPGVSADVPGGGTFENVGDALTLTAWDPERQRFHPRSTWRLPRWFLPRDSAPTLSANTNPARWRLDPMSADHVLVDVATRGQEFVLDTVDYPEALAWAAALIGEHAATPKAHGRRLLLAVEVLHRLGYERLRIAPGLAPSGSAWRCAVVPKAETCVENGALTRTEYQAPASYTTGQGAGYFGWEDAAEDGPEELAQKILDRFPSVVAAARGEDPAYVAWYREMLVATAPYGLPYAIWDSYGDWRLDMTHLKTTVGGPVRVPPPGMVHFRDPVEVRSGSISLGGITDQVAPRHSDGPRKHGSNGGRVMSLYEKPVWALMWDFVKDIGLQPGQVVTRDQVMQWFAQRYPKVKEATLSAHLLMMSTNARSRVHYRARPGDSDLFFQIGPSEFRLYDAAADPAPITKDGSPPPPPPPPEDEGGEFAYERDLRNFLVKNLALFEPGLRLYEDEDQTTTGVEFPAGGRFIDILAVDAQGNYVVIELKVSRGYDRVVGQLLRYMSWIEQHQVDPGQSVRGIIVAKDISEDLRLACSRISDVALYEYQLSVALKKV